MAINSLTRRMVKRALYPLLSESGYRVVQSLVKAHDIRKGTYREKELKLIPRAVFSGEEALDIGANFGLYSYHLSRAVGDSGRVYAFEPVSFTFSCLQSILRLWRAKNIIAFQRGCSNVNETVAFTLPVQESGAITAGLSHMAVEADPSIDHRSAPSAGDSRREHCEVVRIDDFLPEVAPSFMKIDVEGAEVFVLEGAKATVERSWPTVVCEINPDFLEEFGIELNRIMDFFMTRDYELYRCSDDGRLFREHQDAIDGGNYVFVHPTRRARFEELGS